ncbi:MAG: phospho-N-acetylmuramoyl-pentapeptide-transferase [bacterium]|nr:phospho-N-acetylmuramoyl-pentapeptide-transferase [bacterium]
MIPALFRDLFGMQLFGYISFRTTMACLTAFTLVMIMGGPMIAWLRENSFRENAEKTDAPELAALAMKTGKDKTTTMGGSFLIAGLLASVILWCRMDNLNVILAVILTTGLGAVGFVDDYKKLTVKGSKGLSSRSKLLGQSVVALFVLGCFTWYAYSSGRHSLLTLYPPFFKDFSIPFDQAWWGLAAFLVLGWFVIVGTSNAANIVDGLDGLAAGCMLISGLALTIFCYVTGRWDWTSYLNLPYVPTASEMAVMGGALCGACMGFLWFNAYPAQVFMGDSGSLPIGGLLAWMALVSKQELVLPLIGFVLFADLFSTALQVIWFKVSGGKRIFTMAPVHHGLQLKGGIFQPGSKPWHEVTVVMRAWIVSGVCALASLALLKVR